MLSSIPQYKCATQQKLNSSTTAKFINSLPPDQTRYGQINKKPASFETGFTVICQQSPVNY